MRHLARGAAPLLAAFAHAAPTDVAKPLTDGPAHAENERKVLVESRARKANSGETVDPCLVADAAKR